MPIVVLIPGLLFIVALFRDSLQKAFANIYLPLFLVCPIYYWWKVAALPPIDVSQAVLIPLGIALVLKEWRRWRFSIMDLWMGVFIFSSFHADALAGLSTASTFEFFNGMTLALVPYMVGKLLLEKNNGRTEMVKRLVFCLFVACILSAYEYRMGQNPFMLAMGRLFPEESFAWKTQIRWGFGRVSGPFGQSELAGMMLFTGIALALYLSFYKVWKPKFRHLSWLPLTKNRWILIVLSGTLFMTQARGPWLGCLAAVPIALIGRSNHVLRRALVTGTLLLVLGSGAYLGLKAYTSAPTASDEQQTATYRAELLTNYMPAAKSGGPWGWGQNFPRVPGQDSIDNEYLFLTLTQGWVGLLSFCALGLGALVYLGFATVLSPRKQDRYFAFTLFGILVGLLVTVYTVFLGNQPYQLFFLLVGWSQALTQEQTERRVFAFKEIYT